MYGLKETIQPVKDIRESIKTRADELITAVQEEEEDWKEVIEESYRLGKFEEGKNRSLKVKFNTQLIAESPFPFQGMETFRHQENIHLEKYEWSRKKKDARVAK